MKKGYLPYYVSRALLSAVFAVIIAGFTWKAIIITTVFFGFFLLYLHSGWFSVDTENQVFPIRRDTRGQLVQRKALIIALAVGLVAYFLLAFLTPLSGNIAIALAVISYFATQFILFSRA